MSAKYSKIEGEASQLGIHSSYTIQEVVNAAKGKSIVFIKDFDDAIDGVISDFLSRYGITEKFGLLLSGRNDCDIITSAKYNRLAAVIDETLHCDLRRKLSNLRGSMVALLYKGRLVEIMSEVADVLDIMEAEKVAIALPHEISDHRAMHARFMAGELVHDDYTRLVRSAYNILPCEDSADEALQARFDEIIAIASDLLKVTLLAEHEFLKHAEVEMASIFPSRAAAVI